MRVLIVDDSKTMRAIIASYAHTHGLATLEAIDGVDALAKLDVDRAFDAILIDWDMPNMNGLELLKVIRTDPALQGIKTMMITSQSSYDHVAQALALGADDYLMKPFDEEMFATKLQLIGIIE